MTDHAFIEIGGLPEAGHAAHRDCYAAGAQLNNMLTKEIPIPPTRGSERASFDPKRYACSFLLLCFALGTPLPAGALGVPGAGAKVLLVYDMEGVTDVTRRGTTIDSDQYDLARRSLVEDVNATIKGLLRAGAQEVVLVDGHGSGNPEPDYPLERLPPGSRHEIREQPYDPYLAVLDDDYSAVVAIGMHVGSGDTGFLAHTVLPHTRWTANGFEMNESMIVAGFAAQSGAPLILVTGDDALKNDIEEFSPETKYVTVKVAKSYSSAEARPRQQVSEEIEIAAADAFRHRDTIPPWRALATRPIENEFGYRTPAQTELASLYPHVTILSDKAVSLRADDFVEAYLAFRALASYTFLSHMRWVVETISELEDGDEILRRIGGRMPPSAELSFRSSQSHPEWTIFATHGSR